MCDTLSAANKELEVKLFAAQIELIVKVNI